MPDIVHVEDVDAVARADEPYSKPSPSALDLVETCEARAGARYVARIKPPEKPGKNTVGTRAHEITAAYLCDGKAPNLGETMTIVINGTPKTFYPGKIARNIFHHLPPAGTVPDVERKLTLVHRGITFNGSIDFETASMSGDHKFTSNAYGDWIKTPDKLLKDVQRIIYAADWFARYDADELPQQWTYGQFDCRASRPIKFMSQRVETVLALDNVVMPLAEKLLGWVAKGVDWKTLPKNLGACGKFPPDGCPYLRECPRTYTERVKAGAVMASAFADRLRAKKEAREAAAAGGAQVQPTAAALVSQPVNVVGDVTPSNDVENDEEAAKAAIVGAINPPGEAGDVLDAPDDDATPEESEAPAAPEAPAQPAPVAEKKPRGRPRKDAAGAASAPKPNGNPNYVKTEAGTYAPVASPAAVSTAPVAPDEPRTARVDSDESSERLTEQPADKKSLIVFVDCFGARGFGEVTYASDIIEQAHAHVRKSADVVDYRMIDYAKGAGFLAASIAGLIEDLPADTIVVLDTHSPEGMIALQPFMAAATQVVRSTAS